jgi:hypothetical protein
MADHKVDKAEFVPILEKPFSECTNGDLLCYAKRFNICLGDCPAAFAGLTCLWLSNLRFADQLDIPNILSTCKRLESLHLTHCDSGIRSVLQLEHARLVELEVDSGNFERIELTCLPKLQRVSYNNWFAYGDPIYFGFVPQLSKLSLENIGISSTKNLQLSELLVNVPWIKDLRLDFKSEKVFTLNIYVSLLLRYAYKILT